ncbi:type IV toxin-antitoxin system AbiEi family antitoxin [Massilia luteola]|uniref:type IV toxin-antitoxin system AbiEi family antitoxin n=1 Tax=Massilia luteola TaxID=3081751 RepID=UPI002ACC080C|nr:type IV toxin-antitoxin system AbiEi family antitoxin [Massilia sp. Gc5]
MNNPFIPDLEVELVAGALDALHESTRIQGKIVDDAASDAGAVVLLEINGRKLRYHCAVKKKVDRYALPHDLLNRLDNAQHTLLVSSPLSPDMANRCRDIGLQFIDTAGNAYINDGAGIYVHVTGRRGDIDRQFPVNDTMTPAALRMMFASLAEPALLDAPYRDISSRARISTGAISKAFETLESRGLIGLASSGKRMIRTPELFLNEWASGYAGRLKPKLRKYRFAIDNLDRFLTWNPEFQLSAWGGEPAAMMLTGHLKPEACTVYVDMDDPHTLKDIVKDFRLRADPQGRIEIIEMFWNPDHFTDSFPTVPLHLVYADLMATHDSRNIAAARQLIPGITQHVHDSTR